MKLQTLALALLLVAMTLAAYAPALDSGYIWDDDFYVTENPLLHEPDGLSRIWFSTDSPSQYVPMVYTTLRMEYALWGLDPFGYHLVNLLLHAVNALLVWFLLKRLNVPAAWVAAAVFALHPVHVESVAWISELKNVLCLLFSLLSLITWLRFIEPGQQPRWRLYLLSIGLYMIALFSKATACTLPAAMLLIPWMRGEPIDRRRVAQVVPFFLAGIGMGLVIVYWERFHIGTEGEAFELPMLEAVLVASRACWFYLQKLAWPSQLAFSYPRFEIDASDPLQYGWLLAGALLLIALGRWQRHIGRAPLAMMLLFIATLSPVLGFIPLFTFWYTFVADHYQYVASIGPIAVVVGGAAHGFRKWKIDPRIQASIAALLLGSLAIATFNQARAYLNDETLWRATIANNPRSWMAHVNLGGLYLDHDRFLEAIEVYEAALQIRPETHRAHVGLAIALRALGRDGDDILWHLEQARAVKPELVGSHINVALFKWRRGDTDAALLDYEAAAQLFPDDPQLNLLLGRALEKLGRIAEAQARYQRALEHKPDLLAAEQALARLQRGGRKVPESPAAPFD